MKLLTHNFLACNIKGVKNGYPLKIEASQVETRDADMDPGSACPSSRAAPRWPARAPAGTKRTLHADFVRKMLGRVDYGVLRAAAAEMGVTGLPAELSEELLEDMDVIQKLHHALMEVHLEEGNLVCPVTGRRFPVSQGIPNMLLNEDEV